MTWAVWLGVFLPLIGTVLGAAMVFLLKDGIAKRLNQFFVGFAAGVMLAASVWSLILPSAEIAKGNGIFEWLPPLIGVLFGFLLFWGIDWLLSKKMQEDGNSKRLLFLSVTIHNVPEGMAVGACFVKFLSVGGWETLATSLSLSLGIALQNFPEGAIISLPLKAAGKKKWASFLYGFLSGVVEPIFALLTMAMFSLAAYALPWMLAFAAGAMIFVVVKELIPEAMAEKGTRIATLGVAVGFILMMTLDMALG